MGDLELGSAVIDRHEPVEAGSYTQVCLTYTAGHPIDDTGYIKIAFRYAGDFGMPQFADPEAPNYCSVNTDAQCRIEPRWDVKGHTRPWGRALFLKVMGGFVNSGERINVVFGDVSAGSPGWRVQTFCESSFEFKTLVDPIATYQFKELPDSPVLEIVPGTPSRVVCIAPSEVALNENFVYHLKTEDRWGNPTSLPVEMEHSGFISAGVHSVEATDAATGLSARSNPISVSENRRGRWWADFHGQSEETIGTNSVNEYFSFARDYALVDIAGHQGNDFQITDAFWNAINDTTRRYDAPGRFVTFPGYEWSGNTPLGGDRNVFYSSEGGFISRSCGDLVSDHESQTAHSGTADDLFAFLKKHSDHDASGREAFVVPHVGGRYSDLSRHDGDVEWNVEVHSAWGTFEWLLEDAFRLGYRVGVCANSDGHKGRPGASYPGSGKFGSYGGLTCVLAGELTRESVMSALRTRHCYGTTGNRSLLDVRLATADGRTVMMGDVVEDCELPVSLHCDVVGTGPIESVDVFNGTESVASLRPYNADDLGSRFKIMWSGAEVRGRDRAVTWDGRLTLTGTRILSAKPINFWNAEKPLRVDSDHVVSWQSVTTGGGAGVIVTTDLPDGDIQIDTDQISGHCALGGLGIEAMGWQSGGLKKRITVSRLPELPSPNSFAFSLPIDRLTDGDNPVYVRMTQEDGHMAWSSPIYLVS